MRIVRTAYGARLVHGRSFLSKVLREPGPTDEVFDVLAAAVAEAPAGPGVLLGFAGGGLFAPLRAMGDGRRFEAVDLDPSGETVFRELCGAWCGEVRVHRGDAGAWLAARRERAAVVVEDLSTDGPEGATKPAVSLDRLPGTIRRGLATDGWAVVNVLPVPGMPGTVLVDRMTRGHAAVLEVRLRDHENVVTIAARRLPGAREVGRRLRARLSAIGSEQATRIAVRTLRDATARTQNRTR